MTREEPTDCVRRLRSRCLVENLAPTPASERAIAFEIREGPSSLQTASHPYPRDEARLQQLKRQRLENLQFGLSRWARELPGHIAQSEHAFEATEAQEICCLNTTPESILSRTLGLFACPGCEAFTTSMGLLSSL